MSAAESLRIAHAITQMPEYSPSAVAKGMFSLWGRSISELPTLTNGALQQSFGWSAAEVEWFRERCAEPVDRYHQLANRGIRVSTLLNDKVPPWQELLTGAPVVFYRGDVSILEQPATGFSGSRDASEKSLSVTEQIAKSAVEQGMCVLSGGARGIDMAAHTAALRAGGSTVVLIPQGIDTWALPATWHEHRDRVLVMSFDHPWAEWSTPSAMQRNRAIVDLASIVAIPHAGTSGGSHSTGLYALRRGRSLWVADLGAEYPGNQLLLQRGAKPIPWNDGVPDIEQMLSAGAAKPTQQTLF